MNNYIILSVLASIALGLVMVPWQTTLGKIDFYQFFITMGPIFIIVGLIGHYIKGGNFILTANALWWSILTGIGYVFSCVFINMAIGHPFSNVKVVAAIIATYPLATAILKTSIEKQMLSFQEIFFLLLTVGGVVGFSLVSGKS
ncbi:hypothetical protein KKB69_00225 [Patescibacteria group bacterium]|nr:hypothetical protein [Patescibacteria group bacterium]